MRTRLSLLLVGLALGACGGFDNHPLRHGVVRGRLVGADREVAEVFVFGDPDQHASVEDDGSFELDELSAGPLELYVRGSATTAVRLQTELRGGTLTDLGEVSVPPALPLTLELVTPGGQDPREGRVWLDEVRSDELRVSAEGEVTVWLAEGCYRVRAVLDGFADTAGQVCVLAGQATEAALSFAPPDMRDGREGCRKSGCLEGLACMSDGSCR